MSKIEKHVDAASLILFSIGLPFVIAFGYLVQEWVPSVYYSNLSGRFLGIPFSVPFLILVVIFWYGLRWINRVLDARGKKVKGFGRAILIIGIFGFDVLFCGMALVVPKRLHKDDYACATDLIVDLQRCEGRNASLLQDRASGVARFGIADADIIKKIETFPDYSLFQTDCQGLPGKFGETCYTGRYVSKTADTNFMNIYLHKDKILVLETENIVINDTEGDRPVFPPGQEPKLEDFVNLERFRKDMTE